LVASLFRNLNNAPPALQLATTVENNLAELIDTATTAVNFGNMATITMLIQSVEASTSITLDSTLVTKAAGVIAGTNQQLVAIAQTANLAYLRGVAQVKIVSQGTVANDLASAAAGQTSIDTVVANDTGAALAAAIAATATPPAMIAPVDMTVAATAANGAQVNFDVRVFDVGGESLTPNLSSASGTTFPIGVTTVTAFATDSLGDTASASFTITVVDSTPPTITLPSNITTQANTTGGANVTLPLGTATDPVDPNPTVTQDQTSGFFALGTTTVNVTATEAAGNTSKGSFTVTVLDTTPPTLALPQNLQVQGNTIGGANVTLPSVTATDIADSQPTIQLDHSSGFFPLGTTTINATATDASGNSASGSFMITVIDTTPPAIALPANLVVDANATGGANVTLPLVTATDAVDANPTVTEDDNSGFFPLGTTTIHVTATDALKSSSSGSYTVTVVDTPPIISLPANMVVQATAADGANVTLPQVTATDEADPNPTVTVDHSSGTFPLGTTTVNVTATNASGMVSNGAFTVTVENTTPPTLALSANSAAPLNESAVTSRAAEPSLGSITVQANTTGGAIVTLPTATVTDVADPNPLVTFDHYSGFYPLGMTTINVTATDSSGNSTSGTFTVNVVDATPPSLKLPPDVVAEATGKNGAMVTLPAAIATDVADPDPNVSYSPPSGQFPLGVTTVTVTATDASRNKSTGTFTVTVVDSMPPTLTLPSNVMVDATTATGAMVTLPFATAIDLVDPSPIVTYSPPSGFFPIGTTLVTVTGKDASGNATSGTFTVTVIPVVITSTLIDNGPNASTYGDSVSLHVSLVSSVGPPVPDGETVAIEDASNGNAVVGAGILENGAATLQLSKLAAGSHQLFAFYAGDNLNATSKSDVVTQFVNQRPLLVKAVTNIKNYDGTTGAAGMPVVIGLQPGDSITGLKETYADASLGDNKTLTASGTVSDGNGGGDYSVTFVKNLTGVITTITSTAWTVSATEGSTLSGVLATFTDANPDAAGNGFTATIDWGDKTTLINVGATQITGANDTYTVPATHVYAEEGAYTLTLTVRDVDGVTATVHPIASVSDPAVVATPATFSAVEGASSTFNIATFTDPGGAEAIGDYTATIDWGDSSALTSVSGSQMTGGGAAGFGVPGSHVYAEEGSYTLTVTISDVGGATATAKSVANVADVPLTGMSASIASGTTVTGTVASFSDPDTSDTTSDYQAAVDWGDGRSTSGGIVAGATAGQFSVDGNHAYSDGTSHTISVTVTHGTDLPLMVTSLEPGEPAKLALSEDIYVIGSGTIAVSADNGVLANDHGTGALSVTSTSVTGANGGTFVFKPDGSFTYTPPASFPGYDYAQYAASDAAGQTGTATVNVLSQTGGVVWKFYESVLNRDPDYGGLQHWISDFQGGGKTGDIAVGFFESPELLDKIIDGYYEQYLLRPADAVGLDHWKTVWGQDGGPEKIRAFFAESNEFYASAGGTPDAWINALYQRILDRTPDPDGEKFWLNYYQQQVAAGTPQPDVRYNIAMFFLTSKEDFGDDVTGWFDEYLQRAPSDSELQHYVNEMVAGASDRQIEQEITDLPEYGQYPPAAPDGTGVWLPDYHPKAAANQQAALAAKDALFAQWGGLDP
jgi:hypothetical protein